MVNIILSDKKRDGIFREGKMTENFICFAVGTNKKPKDTDNIYNIREGRDLTDVSYYKKSENRHFYQSEVRWYNGTTHFKHIEALRDIANQYGEDLLFFGFSCHDCDFREGETEKSTMSEWKTKR